MANNLAPLNAPDVKFGDLDLDGEMDLLVAGEEDRDFPLAITRAFIGELEEQRPPAGGGMPRWVRDFAQFGVWVFRPFGLAQSGGSTSTTTTTWRHLWSADQRLRDRLPRPSVFTISWEVSGVYALRSSRRCSGGSVEFGDYDNDGDEDLLITGSTEANEPRTLLYAAAGFGTFAPSGVELPGVGVGDGTFADFDGDGDLDILLVGDTGQGFAAYLMENEAGEFTAVTTNLKPVGFASTSWADYDGDGDLDLAISGGTLSGRLVEPETHIYRNDDGVFTDIGADLFGSYYGTVRWGDFDNDGDPDLMEVGAGYVNDRRIGIAYDNQDGTFVRGFSLTGVGMSSSDVGDYDGDGDLDIIILGEGASVLYRNEAVVAANIDGSPAGHPDPPSRTAVRGRRNQRNSLVAARKRRGDTRSRAQLQHPGGFITQWSRRGHTLSKPRDWPPAVLPAGERPEQHILDVEGSSPGTVLLGCPDPRRELFLVRVFRRSIVRHRVACRPGKFSPRHGRPVRRDENRRPNPEVFQRCRELGQGLCRLGIIARLERRKQVCHEHDVGLGHPCDEHLVDMRAGSYVDQLDCPRTAIQNLRDRERPESVGARYDPPTDSAGACGRPGPRSFNTPAFAGTVNTVAPASHERLQSTDMIEVGSASKRLARSAFREPTAPRPPGSLRRRNRSTEPPRGRNGRPTRLASCCTKTPSRRRALSRRPRHRLLRAATAASA